MKVLLPIKPKFAHKIFEGTKKYEFRKSIYKRQNIDKVIVYASSPVQKIIGEFEIKNILCDDTEKLWHQTQKYSGIDKNQFDEYFANKKYGFAIQIGKTYKYETPKNLSELNISYAPQSFIYL